MKRIIRLTEGDLNRIVKRVIKEQESWLDQARNAVRNVVDFGGSIDYNYIENKMTHKELADLIFASLNSRGDAEGEFYDKKLPKDFSSPEFFEYGDAEAPIEAAFLNMSKPLSKIKPGETCNECWKNWKMVGDLYKQRFGSDMMKDIKEELDLYKVYHKKSIKSILNSWGIAE